MEYRVEELARAAGVRVDTVRFYQNRGLIPPPTRRGRVAIYGSDHLERVRRIRELNRQGISLDAIRRLSDSGRAATGRSGAGAQASDQRPSHSGEEPSAVRQDLGGSRRPSSAFHGEPPDRRLDPAPNANLRRECAASDSSQDTHLDAKTASPVPDRDFKDADADFGTNSVSASLLEALETLVEPPQLSAEELAESSGFPLFLIGSLADMGLLDPTPTPEGPRYGESDRRALEAASGLLGAGIPVAKLLPLATDHAEHIERIADRAIGLFETHVRRKGEADAPSPADVSETFRALLPMATRLVALHFERALVRKARGRLLDREGEAQEDVAPAPAGPDAQELRG